MPSVRSSGLFPVRSSAAIEFFALFLALAVGFSIFPFSVAASPTAAATVSCPVEPPKPLRTLYRLSERIVEGRVIEFRPLEGEENENQGKTAFAVMENLKGDAGDRAINVYHWFSSEEADGATGNFRPGETYLLFLENGENEESDGYRIIDYRHGVKKLSEDDLKVYVKRIEELQWIMRQSEPDPDELVEWLVRCAEERATRWEGAYELSLSFNLAEEEARAAAEKSAKANADEEKALAEAASAKAAAEAAMQAALADAPDAVAADPVVLEEMTVETSEEIMTLRMFYGSDATSSLVEHLTTEQKARLSGALFRSEILEEGELELVNIVRHWEDAQLAAFLFKRLQERLDAPDYETERLAHSLAQALKDEELLRLAEKYSEDATYYDPEPKESAEGESNEGETSEHYETQTSEAETEETAKEAVVEEPPSPWVFPDDGTVKLTSERKRSVMLRQFLAAAESRLNRAGMQVALQ